MCFNFRSSIFSWLIASGASIYMLSKPDEYDVWLPLIILTFTQIQIMEAILWANMGTNNNSINQLTTRLIALLLLFQPLVNSYLAYDASGEKVLYYMILFYILLIVYHLLTSKDDTFLTTVGPNGHLDWHRLNINKQETSFPGSTLIGILYLAGIFIPFFYMSNPIVKYTIIGILASTFLWTNSFYTGEFGSMWCYEVAIASIITLIYNKKLIQ